ncbi:OR4 protein, partial [Acromyrmex heyeri]
MNESRPRRQPFNAEFFVDEEQYFYFFRFHICLVIIIIPIVYVASSTLFLTLTQHTCGMCELLGHRAERLFCVVKDEARYDLIQMSQITCGNISVFVQQHYNIIQFVEIIETCHTIPFLIDLISLMILMSLTLIQEVFQIITISGMERAIRSIGVFCSVLCYVFISSYMGQRITDMSSSLCGKIFNFMWYNAVVSEQKTLLIIMMRHYQPLILTACKFYVISLQNFGMVRKEYCIRNHNNNLMSLFMSNITANFVIDMIPALMTVMGSLSQIYARVGHVDKLRDLFEHMWNDWRSRKTNYETKIMQKHAETSKLLTLYYLRKKNIKLRFIQRKRRAFLSVRSIRSTLYFYV